MSVKLGVLVVLRRLVPEVFLPWDSTWADGRSASGKSEVSENFHDHFLFDDSGDGFHFTWAEFTTSHVESEDAGEQLGPADAFLFCTVIFILNFEGFLDIARQVDLRAMP